MTTFACMMFARRALITARSHLAYRPCGQLFSTCAHLKNDDIARNEAHKRALDHLEAQAAEVDRSLLKELPFEDYIKFRRRSLWWSLAIAVPGYFAGTTTAAGVFANQYPGLTFDSPPGMYEPIMGIDPMIAGLGGCLAAGITSAIMFASMRDVIYRIAFSHHAKIMDARETDFRLRIMKNRRGGDAFSDDFYGDKVKTLAAYRSWLRTQYRRADIEGVDPPIGKHKPHATARAAARSIFLDKRA